MKRMIFILTLSTFLFTQQAEITNIQASQRTDGSQIVDITYDLLPDPIFEFFEIVVLVSLDGGENYYPMQNVSGDLGDIIEPGNGKTLTWNFGQQFGETYSDQIKIKIQGSSYALVDNNSNQELPFEMVTVAAGEYTFGENDEIRTIDYDYEIMKYEVTDQDYVLFMMDKLDNVNSDECENYDGCFNVPGSYDSCLPCTGEESIESAVESGWGSIEYYCSNFIDEFSTNSAADACCICGAGSSNFSDIFYIDGNKAFGYYTGDANNPAGTYAYINFTDSKISYNDGIFEVEEGNVNHPVTGVTSFGATAFASHYGMEIPDQYEWQKAARGNTGYDYPWGDEITYQNANYYTFINESGDSTTTAVGSFNGSELTFINSNISQNGFVIETIDSPSPYGAYDMSGNVAEIIYDLQNPNLPFRKASGAYNSYGGDCKTWASQMYYDSYTSIDLGFRCLRVINQSQSRTIPKEKLKENYLNKKNNSLKSNIKK